MARKKIAVSGRKVRLNTGPRRAARVSVRRFKKRVARRGRR
ncbi:hypothetical protein LCGC14_1584130 [marine sediment metagenome]|uniref:Uncharacterized protein n=1 Tax=marine sediment metagenome TaxID=412755 RepID=A0A0F9IFX8_9ZZZZ